ncbi:hypothetical protein CR513_01032, partial [Mucuna pruriens]
MSQISYISTVESLMYVMVCTRHCGSGIKYIVRDYVDSNFASDLDKRKSTTNCVFTCRMSGKLIIQIINYFSFIYNTKAKYMIATQTCKEVI